MSDVPGRVRRRLIVGLCLAVGAGLMITGAAVGHSVREAVHKAPVTHWVTAWSASMEGASDLGSTHFGDALDGYSPVTLQQQYVAPASSFSDQTVRQIMYLHHSGSSVRLELSNEYGTTAATFPSITVGIRQGTSGASIMPGTLHAVTFGASGSLSIPAGQTVESDPVAMRVTALQSLVVSIYVPAGNSAATAHGAAMQTFYTRSGDDTQALSEAGYTAHGYVSEPGTNLVTHLLGGLTTAEYYVARVDVAAPSSACTLVTFGDSITDGYMSTVNADSRYPDVLARRLQANPATRYLSVANEAISGNRLTANSIGPSALTRLGRDALALPNVCGVIIIEGINDIGTGIFSGLPVPASQIIAGYESIAATLRARGIPLYIGTLTPSGDLLGPDYYGVYSTPTAELERAAVNTWIEASAPKFTAGVIDFNAAIRGSDPNEIAPADNSGDGLHPNDTGYAAMANKIPLSMLRGLHAR